MRKSRYWRNLGTRNLLKKHTFNINFGPQHPAAHAYDGAYNNAYFKAYYNAYFDAYLDAYLLNQGSDSDSD